MIFMCYKVYYIKSPTDQLKTLDFCWIKIVVAMLVLSSEQLNIPIR